MLASMFHIKLIRYIFHPIDPPAVGRPKAKVISGCRSAIKNKEVETLFKIMRSGAN